MVASIRALTRTMPHKYAPMPTLYIVLESREEHGKQERSVEGVRGANQVFLRGGKKRRRSYGYVTTPGEYVELIAYLELKKRAAGLKQRV